MGVVQTVELMLTVIAALSAVIAALWARAAARRGEGALKQLRGALDVLTLIQGDIGPRLRLAEPSTKPAPSSAEEAPESPAAIPDGLLREEVRAEINALARRWHTTPLFVLRAAVAVQLHQARQDADRESGEVFRLNVDAPPNGPGEQDDE